MGIYDVDTLQTQHLGDGTLASSTGASASAPSLSTATSSSPRAVWSTRPLWPASRRCSPCRGKPPAIRTSPEESGRLYVQIPTLWIDSSWWQFYTATAQAGRVWSTVTARPVSVTWGTGDGGSEVCRGPGVAWSPGVDEDASNCTHTYRRSSASADGGTFDLSATVRLEITWTSNAPFGGTLPAITRTSTLDVEVGEIQAIGTRGD